MKFRTFAWLLTFICMAPLADSDPFQALLDEVKMEFNVPDGFSDTIPRANPLMQYERALLSPDGVEARYAIRPLGRIQVDYSDAHSAMPEPNHLFPMIFQSLIGQLSKGGHTPSNEYPANKAMEQFGADWASASVLDVKPEFSENHGQALLLAMHRNDLADAYTIVLFDDYARQKTAIRAALSALKFSRQ